MTDLSPKAKQGLFWAAVAVVLYMLLSVFQPILAPFLSGIVIAYLLNPLVGRLERLPMPRWAAVLLVLLLFFLSLSLAFILGVPLVVRELGLLLQSMPEFLSAIQVWVSNIMTYLSPYLGTFDQDAIFSQIKEQASTLLSMSGKVLGGLLAGGSALIGVVMYIVLIPIVAFYMMIDWPKFTKQVDTLLPRAQAPTIRGILADIDRTIAGFIRGQLTVCVALGLIYGLGLALLGLDFGFVVGMAAGALSIIPYVGSGIGLISSIGMAWFQTHDPATVGLAFALFAVGQILEGNVLTPKLVGENVGLHPIWIIFALMAGGTLLGFVGMLVAVPVAAVIGVLVRFAINEYKSSRYYS